MNKLEILHNGIISMSSREIAELTSKQHKHVKRDIKNQLLELNIDESKFGHMYLDFYKREQYEFKLDYDQTMILISGYSISLRAKIIMRWTELENKFKPEPPTQLQLAEQVVLLLKEQQENAPKVALANDCIRDDYTHYSIRDAGKQLGLKQKDIFDLMRSKRLLTSNNLPTQNAINKKLLTLRTNIVDGKNRPQSVMTMENIYNFKTAYEKDFING